MPTMNKIMHSTKIRNITLTIEQLITFYRRFCVIRGILRLIYKNILKHLIFLNTFQMYNKIR